MNILILSTFDRAGGAERVALDLCRAYRQRGHDARMYVRYKRTEEAYIQEVNVYAHATPWAPACRGLESWVRQKPAFRGQYRLVDALRRTALPRRWLNRWQGIEDFCYPYSRELADGDGDWQPDIIHAHNLHGDYFDLNALATLSQQIPVVWTLHDAWALTGHCAYPLGCDRWRDGCGKCPDLTRPPAVLRDRTALNWQRKQRIYAASRLAIATPSRWLMACVAESMLRPWQSRTIPYGMDKRVFRPGDKLKARDALGLPRDAFIGVFVAQSGSRTNPYKDFDTVRKAVELLAPQNPPPDWLLVCIGGSKLPDEPRLRYAGYLSDPVQVAVYYQSADLLIHAAHADNYPLVVLEALTCGTPVVATDVGGIGEQIRHGETGFLVPEGDAEAMAQRVLQLMEQPNLLRTMGQAAAAQVRVAGSLAQHADAYLAWFEELLGRYPQEA